MSCTDEQRDVAERAHADYCGRTGVSVTLVDGACPECGWSYAADVAKRMKSPEWLQSEVARLRDELATARAKLAKARGLAVQLAHATIRLNDQTRQRTWVSVFGAEGGGAIDDGDLPQDWRAMIRSWESATCCCGHSAADHGYVSEEVSSECDNCSCARFEQ